MNTLPGMPPVPEPELPPLTAAEIDLMTENYKLGDPDMVLYAAGHLAAAVEHYLKPKDGDAAAESLYMDAIHYAAQQIERARELLGHYPLCDALATGDKEDCTCID